MRLVAIRCSYGLWVAESERNAPGAQWRIAHGYRGWCGTVIDDDYFRDPAKRGLVKEGHDRRC